MNHKLYQVTKVEDGGLLATLLSTSALEAEDALLRERGYTYYTPDSVYARPVGMLGLWHPALPEVAEVTIERTGSFTRCRSWVKGLLGTYPVDVFTKRSLCAALLLSLLLPLAANAEPCKVNVQTANVAQVAFLPGIGQVKAGEIVKVRPANEAELDAVKGIGEKTLEDIRPHVVYVGETTCTAKQTAPKAAKDGAK